MCRYFYIAVIVHLLLLERLLLLLEGPPDDFYAGGKVAANQQVIHTYRSRRPLDIELRARLRDLANERRRFGYRRLFILLREQGERSGINRIYRLYREEGLTVRKRRAGRRSIGTRVPILIEVKINARWSLDFRPRSVRPGSALPHPQHRGRLELRPTQ